MLRCFGGTRQIGLRVGGGGEVGTLLALFPAHAAPPSQRSSSSGGGGTERFYKQNKQRVAASKTKGFGFEIHQRANRRR